MAKVGQPLPGQLDEQPGLASAHGVLAEDDLAFPVIDLAHCARAVAFMPGLFEAEHVDVETNRAVHVGDEEHRAGVPAVSGLISRGLLCHGQVLISPTPKLRQTKRTIASTWRTQTADT